MPRRRRRRGGVRACIGIKGFDRRNISLWAFPGGTTALNELRTGRIGSVDLGRGSRGDDCCGW